eukprot:SAG31_NODE_1695_length_7508_cov_2.975030_1_plen_70_part_00
MIRQAVAVAALVASSSAASSSTDDRSPRGCSVADFGAVADNKTDGTKAFRAAAMSDCSEIFVPRGVWMT